jgi:Ser-tRNA(Ala) deacylase AlaX
MHTAEHILNQTMVRMFGCPRSKNSHIERKKSKCDYLLPEEPDEATMLEVERIVNEVIDRNLDVKEEEDLGIFEPFKNQLFKVQDGFKKAVEKEVKSEQTKKRYEIINRFIHELNLC